MAASCAKPIAEGEIRIRPAQKEHPNYGDLCVRVLGVDAVRVPGESDGRNEIVIAEMVLAAGVQQEDVIDRVKRELTGRPAKYKMPNQFRVVDTLQPE